MNYILSNFEIKCYSFRVLFKTILHVVNSRLRGFSTIFGVLILSLVNVGLRFIVILFVSENISGIKLGGLYLDFVKYVSAGFLMNTLMVICVESFYDIFRSNYWNGTLDFFLSSPLGLKPLIIGELISRYIVASIYMIALMIVASIFGVYFTISNWILLICFMMIGLLIAHGIGMIATIEFTYLNHRGGSIFIWLFTWLDTMFSGVVIPVDTLPKQLSFISNFMPFRYYYEVVRAILFDIDIPYNIIMGDLYTLIMFALVIFPLGLILFYIGISYAEKKGTIYIWS